MKTALALYVTGLHEIGWGAALVAITMALHGLGMIGTLRAIRWLKERTGPEPRLGAAVVVLIAAAWLITLCHLVEVFAWAGFFVWKGALPNASTAYYVALLDYTTLGCEYDLPQNWRLLEGMIAIAGLMTFAWSTAVLLTLAQDFQDRMLASIGRASPRQGA
ncbi:MAG TPA: hypothetical protein VMT17_02065 [Anaeromyxobacteraceae bacterium]|nr:hypothetical protein [Anaeromyxobacteraceae bacterium]